MSEATQLCIVLIFLVIIISGLCIHSELVGVPERISNYCQVQYEVYGIPQDGCIESFKQRRRG